MSSLIAWIQAKGRLRTDSSFPQLKKPGSITFCHHGIHVLQRHFICLSTRVVSQASKQASIYTKYQFLWWHRFLSHGMITETRNFPEPNTVSLLSEDGEGKSNLMKICFTLWWIFNLKKKKYNNRTNTATTNVTFWRIFVTQSLDEKLTQCIRT